MYVFLGERPRVNQLYAVRGQQGLVLRHLVRRQRVHVGFGDFGGRRRPRQRRVVLRQIGELRRRQLVVGVVMAEDGGRVAFHADYARLQVAADVVGHLPIFVSFLGLSRLVHPRFVSLVVHTGEN